MRNKNVKPNLLTLSNFIQILLFFSVNYTEIITFFLINTCNVKCMIVVVFKDFNDFDYNNF